MSISQNFPDEGPTLNLNFAGSKVLDPRITFSRTSVGTYMDANGLVVTAAADSPRFDHRYVNGEIESLGLLVEESRVTYNTYTEDPTQWNISNMVATGNSVTLPTGEVSTTIEYKGETTDANNKFTRPTVSGSAITAGDTWIYSGFYKKGVTNGERYVFITLQNNTASEGTGRRFDFDTGTWQSTQVLNNVTDVDSGYEEYPNGWYRIWMSCTFPSSSSAVQTFTRLFANSTSIPYDTSFSLWGAQLEKASFMTSYIPNDTSSTKTRTKDRAVIEGTNFTDIFDTSFESFSMFVNYDNLGISTGTNHAVVLFWGESLGYDDRIEFFKDNADPYHIETRAFGGGSGVFSNGNLSAGSTAATQKLAMSWSVPDYSDQPSRRWAFSFNGESVDVVNDGNGSTIPAVTRVGFGINPTRTDFHGKRITFKQITLYSNALTDSQLQNLTK